MFPEHALNSSAVVSDLGRMAVNLDEEDSARIAGQADMREVIHTDNGVVVQEFKGAGQDVLGDDTGHGLGTPMLLTAQLQEMLQWLHNNGDGQSDHSAILKYYERITGVEVRK